MLTDEHPTAELLTHGEPLRSNKLTSFEPEAIHHAASRRSADQFVKDAADPPKRRQREALRKRCWEPHRLGARLINLLLL